MGELDNAGQVLLGKVEFRQGGGQAELLVQRGVAGQSLLVANIGEQHQDAKAHDLTVKMRLATARHAGGRVVERVGQRGVVVEIRLVGKVGNVAGVDYDIERDLLDGFAGGVVANVCETLLAVGEQRRRAGVREG